MGTSIDVGFHQEGVGVGVWVVVGVGWVGKWGLLYQSVYKAYVKISLSILSVLRLFFLYIVVVTPLPFRPKGYCHCLCLSVCPPVRLPVRPSIFELYFVSTITRHRFEVESPNLRQTCFMRYSQLVLKIGVIVRAITRHRFGLESPNFHQTRIL